MMVPTLEVEWLCIFTCTKKEWVDEWTNSGTSSPVLLHVLDIIKGPVTLISIGFVEVKVFMYTFKKKSHVSATKFIQEVHSYIPS
jgi:hypothetical protein